MLINIHSQLCIVSYHPIFTLGKLTFTEKNGNISDTQARTGKVHAVGLIIPCQTTLYAFSFLAKAGSASPLLQLLLVTSSVALALLFM